MWSFSTGFPISDCTEIRAIKSALIHADRRTDRSTDGHGEANRSYYAKAPKMETDKAGYGGMMMLLRIMFGHKEMLWWDDGENL
jgi:hypothetical protein